MFKLQSRSTHSVQSFMPYGELYKYNEKLFLSQGKLAVLLISVGRKQDFDSLSPQVIEILENCFTDKEKSEYFSKKKKFEYLYGRILTKRSIKKLMMYSDFGYHLEHHIEILNNKPNKPDLHIITPGNVPKINFSISHSLNKVVAVSSFNQIGVDIEKVRNYSPALLNKFLNPRDILKLFHCIVEYRGLSFSQNEIYTTIWCIKEAVAKASGLGLKINLRSMKTVYKNNKIFVILHNHGVDELYITNIMKECNNIIVLAEKLENFK